MPTRHVQGPCSIMNRAQKTPPGFKDAFLKKQTILYLSHYWQDPAKWLPAFDMLSLSERHYARCCGLPVEMTDSQTQGLCGLEEK